MRIRDVIKLIEADDWRWRGPEEVIGILNMGFCKQYEIALDDANTATKY